MTGVCLFKTMCIVLTGFTGRSMGKESTGNAGDTGVIPESGKFSWERKWQPTPVFLPGESQGQRSW